MFRAAVNLFKRWELTDEQAATLLDLPIHHHERFMARTAEPEGGTSQFREIVLDVSLQAHDLQKR